MYLKNIFFIICLLAVYVTKTQAQINVFGNDCESYSPYIFDFMPANYETHCFELPEIQSTQPLSQYTFDSEKEIKAASHIEFSETMELTPETGGALTCYIAPSFEVVAYVDDLNNVAKLSKFELGIKPPETVLTAIQNFLNSTSSQELNPFMSDEIDIEAVFTNVSTDTITYHIPPDPPEEVIYTDTIIKMRDGFFTKEVERDISGFDDLYNHPLANNTDIVTGGDYKNLGGGWIVSDSDYPFRIRFAPPKVGEWTCQIKISIQEGQQVYISPTFKFNVVTSNKKGYLQVDNNQRFLKRDGESFRPLGVNYPWPIRDGYPLRGLNNGNRLVNQPQYHGSLPPVAHYEQYLRTMDTLAMNGVNYFRLIMNPWSLDIEYEKLGDYSDRMHIAKEMDLILERAEQNNMLIHWNFMLHNTLQINGFNIRAWDWSDEPHPLYPNTPTQGYCYKTQLSDVETPLDFLTSENAKRYYKERLRYIIARWGYSPDIAMFEHFSEINQIGKRYEYTQDADEIVGTGQYEGNEAVFSDWHGEMSFYLKEILEIPQLLTLSYTEQLNVELDQSFWHGNIDVINFNNYNFHSSAVHGYHRNNIQKHIAERGDDFDNGVNVWGNYKKPLFFSEMGALKVWDCDNGIETRRSIWQSYFWGISGGLEWKEDLEDLSIYKRVKEFISGVDLEGGKWHSGMVKLDNQGRWEYKESYQDDCIREDELADVVYLRSGDQEKAFGVITNRRANYYTLGQGKCVDTSITPAPLHSDEDFPFLGGDFLLQNYGSLTPESGGNRLRIRNMALGLLGLPKEYKIKYYSPYDQVNSIKEETRWAPQLTLDFPEMDTVDIVLFEVFPMGENFKSAENDSSSTDKNTIRLLKDKAEKQEVLIYPNPNNGNFVVWLENPENVKSISISDKMGKKIDSRSMVFNKNQFNDKSLNSGVYTIKVVFKNKVVMKKIIIN